MIFSHVEERCFKDNVWYRIFCKLITKAGIKINGSRPFDIHVNNPNFFKRILRDGSLGLGESYIDGWWECNRLDMLFQRIFRAGLNHPSIHNVKDMLRVTAARLTNPQSRKQAWVVGKKHYDLGNDLFIMMLDSYMQYSCGYWHNAANLEQAQQNKLKMICQKLQLQPGMILLDIGCGWGGLAKYAAKNYGVKVHGITISTEQQKFAQQLCEKLDINISLQDYRDLNFQYDRVVSVGMFEHVGPKNYQIYFSVVRRNLKPDGLFLLQTIGANKTQMNTDPWINKYIFPNGFLPSIRHIAETSEAYFVMEDWHNFGIYYDHTLMAWHERFIAAWPYLKKQSQQYTEQFFRMFIYYLGACAGAFRARNIQLWQILFSPHGMDEVMYIQRRQ